jgi:hypothetical protein
VDLANLLANELDPFRAAHPERRVERGGGRFPRCLRWPRRSRSEHAGYLAPCDRQKCVNRLCVIDDPLHIDFDRHLHSLCAESKILRINLHLDRVLYNFTVLFLYTGSVVNQLIRILNDGDRETLVWLCKHVGDVRVAAAARHLGGNGKPYLSAVCRYLGVRLRRPHQHSRSVEDCTVGDNYLAQIRQLLAQRNQALLKLQL